MPYANPIFPYLCDITLYWRPQSAQIGKKVVKQLLFTENKIICMEDLRNLQKDLQKVDLAKSMDTVIFRNHLWFFMLILRKEDLNQGAKTSTQDIWKRRKYKQK